VTTIHRLAVMLVAVGMKSIPALVCLVTRSV
jgi:hypothetical protein